MPNSSMNYTPEGKNIERDKVEIEYMAIQVHKTLKETEERATQDYEILMKAAPVATGLQLLK
jgi:hypothetical protein